MSCLHTRLKRGQGEGSRNRKNDSRKCWTLLFISLMGIYLRKTEQAFWNARSTSFLRNAKLTLELAEDYLYWANLCWEQRSKTYWLQCNVDPGKTAWDRSLTVSGSAYLKLEQLENDVLYSNWNTADCVFVVPFQTDTFNQICDQCFGLFWEMKEFACHNLVSLWILKTVC